MTTKLVVIPNDVSEKDLGSVLQQENQLLAFISRALTDTGTYYAQIEKDGWLVV